MLTEESCPSEQRYLMLAARLNSRSFDEARASAIEWCTKHPDRVSEPNVAALEALRKTELSNQVAAFVTFSCYADIPSGRVYSAVFDCSLPQEMNSTSAELLFGIFWHRLPTNGLEHGHHQLAVFSFPAGFPPLLQRLPLCDGAMVDTGQRLGLCDAENWGAISASRAEPNYALKRTVRDEVSG